MRNPRIGLNACAHLLRLAAAAVFAACASGPAPQPLCQLPEAPGAPVGPEPWCAEIVPVPELRGARAVLELRDAPAPFGVAVTQDGRARQEVRLLVEGLPDPATLQASAYVAWVTDLTLGDEARLGTVANGRHALGTVDRNQFRLFVTAEPDSTVTQRTGRIVLRGTSPSVRLLAHRDIVAAGLPGATTDLEGGAHEHAHGDWPMPPMDPNMPMMPGVAGLQPAVAPWRPGQGVDPATLPMVGPRRVHQLNDGDTLRLVAGLVRRRVGANTFVMYAFNGQHPGPLIDVRQGATIVVEFENRLDLPSTIHWHGIRLDNQYDGVPDVTQDPVPPGGRFTYHVRLPDAGLYWYHPHVREDIQQDLGLYGNLHVRPATPLDLAPVDREEVLMLDDLLVSGDEPLPWGLDSPTHALMGRFGNVFLINGEPSPRLSASPGEVVRLWLTNVANTRIFNLSIEGARLKLVGAGMGRYEREEFVESVVLAPAERAVVDVRFDAPGRHAILNRIQAVNHMLGSYAPAVDTLGTFDVSGEPAPAGPAQAFDSLRVHADVTRELDALRPRGESHALVLGMDTGGLSGALLSTMLLGYAPPVDWNDSMPMMNWLMTGRDVRWTLRDPATGQENMDIGWRFRVGDVVRLRLTNPATAFHPMSHPVHIHGQRFVVVARNGRPNPNRVWKDTVVVAVGETVDLLVEISNPGRWMVHCHIAEHLGAGMMMVMTVDPSS